MSPAVAQALAATTDGLRPHAAILDLEIGRLLFEVAGEVTGPYRGPAALAKARDLLTGDPTAEELRAALTAVLGVVRVEDVDEQLCRVIGERRRVAVAQARIESAALDVPPTVIAFVAEILGIWGRNVARAKLDAETANALRRGIVEDLDRLASSGGEVRWPILPAAFLAAANGYEASY